MINYKNYTPILRWKAAEKGALEKLSSGNKENITPLIEFIMPQQKSDENKTSSDLLNNSIKEFQKNLINIPKQILKCWGCNAIFIDMQFIDGSIRAKSLENLLNYGKELGLFMIPVINIMPIPDTNADIDTKRIAIEFSKNNGCGLCVRIVGSSFNEELLSKNIESFISNYKLNIKSIDLLIDLKVIDDKIDSGLLLGKIKKIPHMDKWRRFIMEGGNFTNDLSMFEKHNQYNISRIEWLVWKNLIDKLKRPPSFSDYTIQHPIYTPPKGNIINPSASIRYTLEDKWLVIRGEGLRNPKGSGFRQYPAQALLLVKQKEFKGALFSFGDEYIKEKSSDINTKKTGNPKTWLLAGINHHLVLVERQVSNLS